MLECLEIRDEENFSSRFSYATPDSELSNSSSKGLNKDSNSLKYGKFSFGNLEKGQGLTLANALRRVLLYEFPAYGITTVCLKRAINDPLRGNDNDPLRGNDELIYHEFSNLPGVKESVIEILSNFKSLIFAPVTTPKTIAEQNLISNYTAASLVPRSGQTCSLFSPCPGALHLTAKGRKATEISGEYKIAASELKLPDSIILVNPNYIIATLISPETDFTFEFTIEQITQVNLTNPSSFSGRAPLRSTRYRRLLPVDGTEFPIKKVNYTIEQDLSGKEIVFFEIWTNGAIHPKEALLESIEKVIKLFQKFQ